MTKTIISTLIALMASLVGFFSVQAFAASQIIEDAKSQCLIGEQIDGYLGTITGQAPPAEVAREVRSVNQQRKAAYANIARKTGLTIDLTAKRVAEKQINKAPSGHCVQNLDRSWRKK